MIDDKYIELMNKEIDGVLSAEESAKLKAFLAKNSEAQSFYNSHVKLSTILNQVKAVEPPTNLKKYILNSIELNKYAIKERKRFFQPLIDLLSVKVKYKLIYSFSAGIIVGILILALLVNTSLENANLTGTIILDGTSQGFETADKIEDERFGTVEIKFLRDVVLAEIDLAIRQEVKLVIQFDENDIAFAGFRQLNNWVSNLEINDDSIIVTSKDATKLIVVFNDKSRTISPMTFKISSDALHYEKTLYTGRKNEH